MYRRNPVNRDFTDFTVSEKTSIVDALIKIDNNKQGFLVVTDADRCVLGVLTDGDVRRAIIKGHLNDESISDIYTRNASTVRTSDGFEVITEMFKNQAIKFIPIVDDNYRLVNIITKNQMHALLLQDIHADYNYDFLSLDTSVVDHEIFQRPWGYYKTTILNDYFQGKIISVKPKAQLSLQSHNLREEYWIIVHGKGMVQLDASLFPVTCGSTVFIPKECKHRLTNTDEKENLIITEVQIGSYFGEDDIIRYEDIYGRLKNE